MSSGITTLTQELVSIENGLTCNSESAPLTTFNVSPCTSSKTRCGPFSIHVYLVALVTHVSIISSSISRKSMYISPIGLRHIKPLVNMQRSSLALHSSSSPSFPESLSRWPLLPMILCLGLTKTLEKVNSSTPGVSFTASRSIFKCRVHVSSD